MKRDLVRKNKLNKSILILVICLVAFCVCIVGYNLYYYEYLTHRTSANRNVQDVQTVDISSEEYHTELKGTIYIMKNHKGIYVAEYQADKADNLGIFIQFPGDIKMSRRLAYDSSYVNSVNAVDEGIRYFLSSSGGSGIVINIRPQVFNMDGAGVIMLEFKIPPSVYRDGELTINTYTRDDGETNTFNLKTKEE